MSDRDQFAMAALQGWLASARRLPSPGLLARQCYDYAEAMLQEQAIRTNPTEKDKQE